jgi:hypothetical protein
VAPLEGIADLHVDISRIWFEEARRRPVRRSAELDRVEQANRVAVDILDESRRVTHVGDNAEEVFRAEIGVRGSAVQRPLFLPGYVTWEHELQHHDPLTDIFSLGLILASLACGLDLSEPDDLERFVAHRRNLFALQPALHPALAQAIWRMTELDRRRRAQDLPALLASLEHYRDQSISFEIDLARMRGLQSRERDGQSKSEAVLTRLRDRLFDVSRRNSLLHFRATMGTANLTHASIPLLMDIRNIRDDQLFIWSDDLRRQLVEGKPIPLNRHLNFAEAIFLPSLLERILADARRDQQEYGFAQLRLVLCFLSWANLKDKPFESYVSPLVLLPVRLSRTKGIRDTYHLESVSSEAEVNPVVRHEFHKLYGIRLPEFVDLAENGLDSLFEYLVASVQASEPAVSILRIDRPRIDLIHEKARRRLDQYRRNARVAGRGVRTYLNLDYSYDPANYHPLGLKLFLAKVRAPGSRLRAIIEEHPRPRSYASCEAGKEVVEKERTIFQVRETGEDNPYLWNFDLCSLTLANFRYRRMSLVRDFEAVLETGLTNPAFDATFSLLPRPVGRQLPPVPPLEERFDVVSCDPTQATAIAEARGGGSYIVQGPPGTGKSQTITNLIADFAARGRRVLFVCEKRAAIDVVYARLRQCGLGSLCCLVHDSQTDKREFVLDLKQTYESFLEQKPDAGGKNGARDKILLGLRKQLTPLERFDEYMTAEHARAGLTARRLLDRCLEMREQRRRVSPEEAERLPCYASWWSNRETLAGLEPMLRELRPDGVLARHPLRWLSPGLATAGRPAETVAGGIERMRELLVELDRVMRDSGVPVAFWPNLSQVRQIIDYARQVEPIARHGNLSLLTAASTRSKRFARALTQVKVSEAAWRAALERNVNWQVKLAPADLAAALAQARRWEGQLLAMLSPGWWRLRGLLNRIYHFGGHAVRPTWTQILTALEQEYDAAAAHQQVVADAMSRLGLEQPPAEMDELLRSARASVATLPEWLRRFHQNLLKSADSHETLERILAAARTCEACETEMSALLAGCDHLPLDTLLEALDEIGRAARQVPQALGVVAELARLPPGVAGLLREMPWTLSEAEATIAHQTWEDLCQEDRAAGNFRGDARRRHVDQVASLYDDWLGANAREICRRVHERFLEHVQTSNLAASQLPVEQREFKRAYSQGRRTLEHEFGKSMRFRAIRELVDGDTGLVLRDLKPVWLMSPLSVSDALPLLTDFVDVVIFDEASQVPLEEAVPPLFRGKQVIVVGDEMQLPPTDFFSVKQPDEDDELVVQEGAEQVRFDLASDSFLNHAAKNLPSTMLGWHYRSRSESLISFSNWAFYDGRLLTVPEECLAVPNRRGATGCELLLSRPLSFHFLEQAVYDKRRNRAEADYIAHLVRDLLQRGDGYSLGVIAFSEAQQDEINLALDRLAQEDDAFREAYELELQREVDGQFVGLLVKNLENIQGDERDVVILSICYGPGPDGRMLMNFGPINQSGGEKRLNVAFSRAKQHMAVVSSIRHARITNDYNEGANCLKNYLRYAEALSAGDMSAARRVLAGISRWRDSESHGQAPQDAVVAQLAAALRQRGFHVDEGVGQSHFRVDLAVRRDSDDRYRLGVLVDTLTSYEQSEPLERDMMRPRLLRAFGWRVTSVLAKDWYQDPDAELDRILKLLDDRHRETG